MSLQILLSIFGIIIVSIFANFSTGFMVMMFLCYIGIRIRVRHHKNRLWIINIKRDIADLTVMDLFLWPRMIFRMIYNVKQIKKEAKEYIDATEKLNKLLNNISA